MPSSAQIIAARALLGMEQRELARLSKVHVSTMVRIEAAGWKLAPGTTATVARVVDVLEHRGVEFIDGGVRVVRKPRR